MGTGCTHCATGSTGGLKHLGAVFAVAVAVLLAACGGADDDGSASTTTGPTTTGPTTTTTSPPPPEPATSFAVSSGVVIAHRGASGAAPEHTFAAYDLAVAKGADYLEEDLQLTADGVAVVLHDSTLDRTVRGPAGACSGAVAEHTLAELEACDAGIWFNETNPDLADEGYVGQPLPTLAQVFDRYGSDVRHYIEIKSPNEQPGLEEALLAVLDATEFDAGDGILPPVVIQSFIGDSLRRVHEQRPDLPLVQLIAPGVDLGGATLDRIAEYAVAIAPKMADVDAGLVAAANERCLDVHPWTVNDVGDMKRLLADGVGAMFTNQPGRLGEVRGEQPARAELCIPDAVGDGP